MARRDLGSLGSMLRLVDYWMTQALSVRTASAAADFIAALRPTDLPDFEVWRASSRSDILLECPALEHIKISRK